MEKLCVAKDKEWIWGGLSETIGSFISQSLLKWLLLLLFEMLSFLKQLKGRSELSGTVANMNSKPNMCLKRINAPSAIP